MRLFKRKVKESDNNMLLFASGRSGHVSGLGELSNSAFWSCVIQLAKIHATLPWAAYSKDSQGNRKNASRVISGLLAKPNKWMTSYQFRFIMAFNAELHGEAYAIIVRTASGIPSYLVPVSPNAVVCMISNDGVMTYRIAGKTYAQEEVLAVKLLPSGLTTVLSPAVYAADDVDFERKSKDMQKDYFDGASVVGNLIKAPSSMTKDQKRELKTLFDTADGFRNIVIDNRIDVVPIQMKEADVSRLIEASKWTAREVASRFCVPGFFVGLTEGAYNNLEDQMIFFLTYSLNPRLRAWEESLKDALCEGNDYVEFNREGLLQANSAAKVSFYNSALDHGWMSRNEIRAKENLPSLGPDGDKFFMQSSMATVDNIISGMYGNNGAWDSPDKDERKKPAPKAELEEKGERDRRFVEEATKQAKTARKGLENELRAQLKDDLAAFRGYLDAGMGYDAALAQFCKDLKAIGDKHRDTYLDIYRRVAARLKPVVTKQCKSDQEIQDEPLEEFIGQYVDGLMGRHEGFIYKRMANTPYNEEGFETESENLKANYPFNESNEEVNRSSNALSLFMFAALGVTAYHIVANSDCCAFCEQMDGKVASINGYILTKGAEAPDGDGGVRKIDKNYRHPPFHTFCGCHVAPGE